MSGLGLLAPALGSSERYRIRYAVIELKNIALLMVLIDETLKANPAALLEPRRDQRDRSVGGRRHHVAQCGHPVANDWVRHTLAVRNQIA